MALGECYEDPCRNGGECTALGAVGDGRVCRCLEGWRGESCESRVRECQENPCTNGGSCEIDDEGFFCACPYPYTGPVCQDQIFVPRLNSPHAYLAGDPTEVDLMTGFQFRFRPEVPGFLFFMTFQSGITLRASYTDSLELQLEATIGGKQYNVLVAGVMQADWNSAVLSLDKDQMSIGVNGQDAVLSLPAGLRLKSVMRRPYRFFVGDARKQSSFVGCFYDPEGRIGVRDADNAHVSACTGGTTCSPLDTGSPCGAGGTCGTAASCRCPLGKRGEYCEKTGHSANPGFDGDGFVRIPGPLPTSFNLDIAIKGNGPVFLAYDKQGGEVLSIVVEDDSVTLQGVSKETVLLKGNQGRWLDLKVTLSTDDMFVLVELGSGEELMTLLGNDRALR